MARLKDKQKAIDLRLSGKSYSQIKEVLDVNKSTLSNWLSKYPLSNEKIKELRDWSSKRIEHFRQTMAEKKKDKLEKAFSRAKKDISKLSSRDLFIGGLFLYWGEGSKRDKGGISFTNTNPFMIKFFIKWLEQAGFKSDSLKVNLHLYSDMDQMEEIKFWSRELKISKDQFRRPYVKDKKSSEISYKNGFGHGTCSVVLEKQEMNDYVLSSLKYLEEIAKSY